MCHKNKLSLCLKAEKSRRQKELEEISLQSNVSLPLMSKLKLEVFVRDRFQKSKTNALFSNVLTKI